MASNTTELNIKINTQTGELEVLGAKFRDAGKGAVEAESSFKGLGNESKRLLGALLPFASSAAILAFFKSAVSGAEEMNEALRRLEFAVNSTGGSWDKSKVEVRKWLDTVQLSTRFTDQEAARTLEKFSRVTNDTAQAMRASQISMGLQIQTGKSADFINNLLTDTINREQGALQQLRREFGALIPPGNDFQAILDTLDKTAGDLIFTEDGLTKATAELKGNFDALKDEIGNALIPAATAVSGWLTKGIQLFQEFSLIIAGQSAKLVVVLGRLGEAFRSALTLDFAGTKDAFRGLQTEIQAIEEGMLEQFEQIEQRKTATVNEHAQRRVEVSTQLSARELASIEQLEQELDQKLAALGTQTFEKKMAQITAEVNAKRAAINQQITDETNKTKLLAKLAQLEVKQKQELAKQEVNIKLGASLQIADLAVQTLQTVNALGDKGSQAERTRAKALLALQQAIAIGWIWVNAIKTAGPFAAPLAAAQTALVVAQFASQLKAIDKAGESESAGIAAINTREGIPGIDLNAPSRNTVGSPQSSGGFAVSGVGGGGGGGGGSQTIINVGGVQVNIDVSKLSVDNIQVVMLEITERVRQGTVEGVQMALALNNSIDRNSKLAV